MDAYAPTVVPAPPTRVVVNEDKAGLRRRATERRRSFADQATEAGVAVASLFGASPALAEVARVATSFAGYWPIKSEIDPRPLMRQLLDAGKQCGLPVTVAKDEPLMFRQWAFGDRFEIGAFGVSEPLATAPAIVPKLLLVPLLAFDRRGHRLGYGAGYYDRTLAQLRRTGSITAVGLAFAGQEVGGIPSTNDDQPLDWVVTEKNVIEVT